MELIKIISLICIASFLIGFAINTLLQRKSDVQISIFQNYLLGMVIIYLGVLLGVPLDAFITGLFVFSIPAFIYFIYVMVKLKKVNFSPINFFFLILFICIAIYVSKDTLKLIVYTPITEWDSRSIWYFKAKQLFFANGLNENTGVFTNHFSVYVTHAEYPFLVPMLGAFIAKNFGFWNEFLPKSNLIFLWIGMVLALCSLKKVHFINKILILVTFLIITPNILVVGYLDAWLAIYASLSIFFLIAYTESFRSDYLVSSLCCLIFINYLKQDAALVTLSILVSYTLLIFSTKNYRLAKFTAHKVIKAAPLLLLMCFPFFVFMYYKWKWNLVSGDFDFNKLLQFSGYGNIFTAAKFASINKVLFGGLNISKILPILFLAAVLGVAYAVYSKFNTQFIKRAILIGMFPLLSSLFFTLGMNLMYCISTKDLMWHLNTSGQRLSLSILFLALPTLYSVKGLFLQSPGEKAKNATIKKQTQNVSKGKSKPGAKK